jgi:hypothetical protein
LAGRCGFAPGKTKPHFLCCLNTRQDIEAPALGNRLKSPSHRPVPRRSDNLSPGKHGVFVLFLRIHPVCPIRFSIRLIRSMRLSLWKRYRSKVSFPNCRLNVDPFIHN